MDNPNCNIKNLLVELESLKSKECIFKIKEINFIRDKEILEESIKAFQTDIQEKSETIRSLRRDLDVQSSDLYKDLQIKTNECDKIVLENEDLKKQNVICQETIQHHVQRIDALKLDLKNQQTFFEREIECKSKLAGFYETSSQQKENKLFVLIGENEKNQILINDLTKQLQEQSEMNHELNKTYEESLKLWKSEELEKDEEIKRIKNEIVQLQQNGISELHLEKMNPIAAATLKVLKPSRGLMEIYTELHSKISEVDHLQMEKDRFIRKNNSLETELQKQLLLVDRLNSEFEELKRTSEGLKGRLLGLVTELRASESKKSEAERQLLVTKKNLEYSNKEINRLNEQISRFIVISETGSQIKQEEVDTDSGLYASVQELQEVNRLLRVENEKLMTKLDLSDYEQYKQRCEELHVYSEKLDFELVQLRLENSAYKNQLNLLEKQVKLLRYLTNLKAPLTVSIIENGLKLLEHDNSVCLDCENECELDSSQCVPLELAKEEIHETSCQQNDIDCVINDLLDNKRASDQVYVSSIENMRDQLMNLSFKYNQLQEKFERSNEQLTEEKELNIKYHNECSLLRSLNKNLSSNSSNLESHIEDLKLKLECKINLLAERKAEIDSCRNQIDILKSDQMKLRIEKDELMKTADIQTQMIVNINSLESGAGLADRFYRIQISNKISDLEKTIESLSKEIDEKDIQITELKNQEDERKALETVANVVDQNDIGCQACLSINESDSESNIASSIDNVENSALCDSLAQIEILKQQLYSEKTLKDQLVSDWNEKVEQYKVEMKDLNQKCEFFETQISLQEKARQEILNENIKITEEAHNMNASLKLNLSNCADELAAMKVRLEEAENVKRTVQTVIDKYLKEANEAKSKYKRELTLHAADSKLLEAANKEIEYLKSLDKSFDQGCAKYKLELLACEEKYTQQIEEMQETYKVLEAKLHESENRNERLYDQLHQVSVQNNSSYQDIIEDLRNQINISKMSFSLSDVQSKRYVNEIAHLRDEINYMQENSTMVIDRLNKSQNEESNTVIVDVEVVRESNHVLRQQKEQLEKSIINLTGDMEILTEQVEKLKSNVTELNEAKNYLNKIKNDLEEEKNRWKDRCTKLVERAEQMDPEQYKNACNDRDKFRKQVHDLDIKLSETKEAFENLKSSSQKAHEEHRTQLEKEQNLVKQFEINLAQFRNALAVSQIEVETTKKLLEDETSKLDQQVLTNNLLKDIGRKYKNESTKKRLAIIDLEKQLVSVNEQITSLTSERSQLEFKIREMESEVTKKQELLTELQSRCECLERINHDYWTKIQINQSDINKLTIEHKSTKRSRDSEDTSVSEGNEPDLKRSRFSVRSSDEDQQCCSTKSDSGDQYQPSSNANESLNDDDELDEKQMSEFDKFDFSKENSIVPAEISEVIDNENIEKEEGEIEDQSPKETINEEIDDVTIENTAENNTEANENFDHENENVKSIINNIDCYDENRIITKDFEFEKENETENSNAVVYEFDVGDEEIEEEEVNDEDDDEGEGEEEELEAEESEDIEDEQTENGDLEDIEESSDNESVIVIDDDSLNSDEKDSNENEDDYEALISKVEAQIESTEIPEEDQEKVTMEMIEHQPPVSNCDVAVDECDDLWNNKLIAMVSSSVNLKQDESELINKNETSNQIVTRGRFRRQLRRLNQAD